MTEALRWVLVAGTGRQAGLPETEALLAEALGAALAEQHFGLVVGGWPGVDYLVARGFERALHAKARDLALSDYLIQVVADCKPAIYPPQADYPNFRGGYEIKVPTGTREWLEALKYADAVVLLGGEGGTRETYFYATQEQRPVFPVACTGGDAAWVFQDCAERWEVFPYQGFTQEEFIATLTQPAADAAQARHLTAGLLQLLKAQFAPRPATGAPLFISYAHEDRAWLLQLRAALRPLERHVELVVWDDQLLQAGDAFRAKIVAAIDQAQAAILVISDDFFESSFIRQHELPRLLGKRDAGTCRVLWLLVGGRRWHDSELRSIISVNKVDEPLNALMPAQRQKALIDLRNGVALALGQASAPSAAGPAPGKK